MIGLPQLPMSSRTYQRPGRGPIQGMSSGPGVPMGGHDPNTPINLPFGNTNPPSGTYGIPRGIPQWQGMQQNPYQMGRPQLPGVGQQMGLPPWLQQRQPVQMGQPQWPGMQQSPYQMGMPQYSGMQNPYQMGRPQWPGMQQRPPMMQQQAPWGMPQRY